MHKLHTEISQLVKVIVSEHRRECFWPRPVASEVLRAVSLLLSYFAGVTICFAYQVN